MHTKFCLGRPRVAFLVAIALIVVGQAVFPQAPPNPQPPAYTIKNLGTLCVPTPELGCESDYSFARDVNNLGQVVGGSSVVQESGVVFQLVTGAFRTSAGEPIDPSTDLLHSPFEEGTAFAINDSGRAVGTLASNVSESEAFVVTGNGSLAFLPGASTCLFFKLPCSAAFGINNSAAVVGSVVVDIGPAIQQWHAARWTSVLQDLGGQQSAAYAINDFGLTVGLSHAGFGGRAVVFGGLSPLSLGTLGGNACDSCDSIAYGVNNGGAPDPTTPTTARIVGESSLTPTGPRHGFVFQLGPGSPGMQDLGTLLCAEGDCDSTAFDINDVGHIVGKSEIDPFVTHAFLYKNNQMVDLNSVLGPTDQAAWELGEARAINDLGQIAGTGQFQGNPRAFLMTPPLSSIFDNVSQLVAVALSGQPRGTSQSLLAILEAAQDAIERGQSEVAGVQLYAYEQEVRAQIQGRLLTEIQGAKLLAGATLIRRVMEEERRR
jgi:probable HAF family extracellular repeat protein